MPIRLTFFQQRSPRSFQYRPRYYREPEQEHNQSATHAERIKGAFSGQDAPSHFRQRLENRRLLPSVDNSRAQMKLMRWVLLAGLAGMAYIALSML